MTDQIPESDVSYHLVGLGGVGMSALAEWLISKGISVSGSDRSTHSPVFDPLLRAGLRLFPQDGSGLSTGTTLVFSTAIEEDNPDLQKARSLQLDCLHRAEVIARYAEGQQVVAVSGTAGKTTMTALLGWILTSAGMDPDVINGGILLNWQAPGRLGASRSGGSGLFVVEADESDRSFLRLNPEWAIISNLAQDHFALDETISLFQSFAGQVQSGIISGAGVVTALGESMRQVPVTELNEDDVEDGLVVIGGRPYRISLHGKHNALNAGLVIHLCLALGVEADQIQLGLDSFKGVHRRLEQVGMCQQMLVFDDYAHNPMKMRAAIETLQNRYSTVTAFWRPHGYTPLRIMSDDLHRMFKDVLRPNDLLMILPVYYAGGTADRSLDSDQLAQKLQADGAPVGWVEDYASVASIILQRASDDHAVLGMGARDPQIPIFLRGLTEAP